MLALGFAEIEDAARRIGPVAVRTPLLRADALERLGLNEHPRAHRRVQRIGAEERRADRHGPDPARGVFDLGKA
jgi:hypothetical protein